MKRRLSEINDTARRSLAIKFPDSHCIFDVIYMKNLSLNKTPMAMSNDFSER